MNCGKEKSPWYSAGLHFECLKCGRCCSGPAEGYIWVTDEEIRLIAGHLNIPVEDLKKTFLRRVGLEFTIIEDAQTNDCVFVKSGGQGKQCSIYPVRPSQCRNWPFWPSNLICADSWNMAALRCPGINRGTLYSYEDIEAKKENKSWRSDVESCKSFNNCHSRATCPERTCLERSRKSRRSGNPVFKDVVREVGEIYSWLDEQLNKSKLSSVCSACGKCCDFQSFGHKLFVTTPEMIYFADKIGIQTSQSFFERPNCHFDRSDALRREAEKSIKTDSSTSLRYARNDIAMTVGQCSYQVDGKCSVYPYRFAGCRIFSCKAEGADFQSELTESAIKKFKAICENFQIPYRYVDLPTALIF